MSDVVILGIITAVGSVLSPILILWVKFRLEKVHTQIDGRMSELLVARKAEGNLEGRDQLTQEGAGQKDQIDINTQRIIDAVKESAPTPEPAKVIVVENKDKEVIIKKNLDK